MVFSVVCPGLLLNSKKTPRFGFACQLGRLKSYWAWAKRKFVIQNIPKKYINCQGWSGTPLTFHTVRRHFCAVRQEKSYFLNLGDINFIPSLIILICNLLIVYLSTSKGEITFKSKALNWASSNFHPSKMFGMLLKAVLVILSWIFLVMLLYSSHRKVRYTKNSVKRRHITFVLWLIFVYLSFVDIT